MLSRNDRNHCRRARAEPPPTVNDINCIALPDMSNPADRTRDPTGTGGKRQWRFRLPRMEASDRVADLGG
jgi:hypothetical protein